MAGGDGPLRHVRRLAPDRRQVIAHPWRDDVALATASALEAALSGYAVSA
jgi:hypothetical protein